MGKYFSASAITTAMHVMLGNSLLTTEFVNLPAHVHFFINLLRVVACIF